MTAIRPAIAGEAESTRSDEMIHQRPALLLMMFTTVLGIALTWVALGGL